MTFSTRALVAAVAVTSLLPVATPARPSTARLRITAVVVRRTVIPVHAAAQGGGAAAAAPPGPSARVAPAADGAEPVVVFTDGSPPAFVVRSPTGSDRDL